MKFCWKKNGKEVELVFQEENGIAQHKGNGRKEGNIKSEKKEYAKLKILVQKQ